MSAIFISYRREDAEDSARALYETLVPQFGRDRLFMDVEAIALGSDFREAVEHSLDNCGVFLAVIGPTWLNLKDPNDPSGRRRLDNPGDYVRQEVATALKRGSKLPVIPVLVRGATMPAPDNLPDDLKDLAYRNALTLTHLDWDGTVQKLVAAIRPHVGEGRGRDSIAAQPADVRMGHGAAPFRIEQPAAPSGMNKLLLIGIPLLIGAAIVAYFLFRPSPTSDKLAVTILAPNFSAPNFTIDGQNVPLQGQAVQLQLAPGEHHFLFPRTGCAGSFVVKPGKTKFLPESRGPTDCRLLPANE